MTKEYIGKAVKTVSKFEKYNKKDNVSIVQKLSVLSSKYIRPLMNDPMDGKKHTQTAEFIISHT